MPVSFPEQDYLDNNHLDETLTQTVVNVGSQIKSDMMDAAAANTGAIFGSLNHSSKQKKEVALCDWLAVTSCLWLYIQKQNQGLWTSHDSVSLRASAVSGCLHNAFTKPGCHNTGKQL